MGQCAQWRCGQDLRFKDFCFQAQDLRFKDDHFDKAANQNRHRRKPKRSCRGWWRVQNARLH
jgi:hypothetical protein